MSLFSMIWQLVALSTFWCVGIYMMSDPGDIFYFLRWLTDRAPGWVRKPVIGCINCMASLHTALVMWLYARLTGFAVDYWWQYGIIYLFAAIITCGTNGIVYVIYNYFKQQEIAAD